MTVRSVTVIVLGVVLVGLIGWDVYAIVAGGVDATISRVVLKASLDNPIIPFALGVVAGHLVWPQPSKESSS